MNVLFVSSGNKNDGPNPIIFAQGESLKRKGISLEYFTINGKGAKGYASSILKLRQHLKQKTYDIIHAHYGLAAINSYLAKKGEKIIVSFMGDDILGSNSKNSNITGISLMLARFNAMLARQFYHFSIVKSMEMRQKLSTKKVSVIPNGVDISRFRPVPKNQARTALNIPIDQKLAIFVSDPDRVEKNFPLARQAVVNSGIKGLKLLPVFKINQDTLNNYYNAADVLLLSSFHEGSPNVIKEAMACNCPIVSTDVGDVKWVTAGVNGCFMADFKVENYAEAIKKAINFSDSLNRTNGRMKLLELGLDSETIASKVINIYQSVLQKENLS